MTHKNLQLLYKFRWVGIVLLALIFAWIFAVHSLTAFLTITVILSILGNLLVYHKGLWLVFFVLSLLPTLTTSIISESNYFGRTDSIVFFAIFLLSLLTSYFLARRAGIIPKIHWKYFRPFLILLGFFMIFVTSMLTGMLAQVIHETTSTANQEALNKLQQVIPYAVFATQTVFAGFFEELTYRVGIFELVFKKHPIIAFFAAALLFAYMHSPTDLYSWLTYGLMSLVLTGIYAKYRNFYLNMSVHMVWNIFGLLMAFSIR